MSVLLQAGLSPASTGVPVRGHGRSSRSRADCCRRQRAVPVEHRRRPVMKIALLSEHASPLAALGDVDSGGQNVYVRALAMHLAKLGHEVCVYTRRSDKNAERTVRMAPRCRVVHVDAGPPTHVPKDDMFPLMDQF